MLSHSITAAGAAALMTQTAPDHAAERPANEPFGYCFNTSTIRGQKMPLAAEIEIVARAGFRSIEPWVSEIDEHARSGGSLSDLKKRFSDAGLSVESVIGFAEWIVDDDARRAKGLEEARRIMDLTVEIGGHRIAAPPAGASEKDHLDLPTIAQRYRDLLTLGQEHGVVPQLELWGFSRVLSKLSEVTFVAMEADHPRACILADAYHLYKGGSDFASLRLLSGQSMHVFHINDYPAKPERKEITDAHRVFPGDGIAPLGVLFRNLKAIGFRGMLSLELFNREYWNQDPLLVARRGLEKTREAVQKSLA
ncbi:MAG TPA: sugar phosphate isomerase/epimerase [Pirellulales bacterium]|jgi:sugar phosphate isomerase/epimerase|nr:sugar phosphate isomerase/epimerase [Pirellulales bacterium]